MASKSLNLLLNSALVAMAVGLVAFNTGILDPILPSRQVATEAAPESAGSTVAGDATGTKPDASTSDENGDMAQSEAADDDGAGKSDVEATDAGAGRDVAKLSEETGDGGMEESDARSAGTGIDADAPAKPAGIVPPRFDIVRVEPDGNVIIAGAAAAGSLVEVVTGSRTLGDATATDRGDFAVILSEPLEPGDYIIVLRATSPEKVVAMSTETAIVSIPKTEDGDVLAIVDEPGKPSKLIAAPEGEEQEPVEKTETEVAAAGKPDAVTETATADDVAKSVDSASQAADAEMADRESAGDAASAAAGGGVAKQEKVAKDDTTEMAVVSGDSAGQAADAGMADRESAGDVASAAADSTGGDAAKQEEVAKDDTTEMAVVSGDSASQAADAEMADRESAGDVASAAADSIGGDAAKQEEVAKDDTTEMAAVSGDSAVQAADAEMADRESAGDAVSAAADSIVSDGAKQEEAAKDDTTEMAVVSGDSANQAADAEMADRESAGDAASAAADSTGGDAAKQEEVAKDDTTEMAVVSGDSANQTADAEMADRESAGDAVSAADSTGGDAAKQEEAAKDDTIEMAAVSESKPEEAGEAQPVEQKTPPADDLSIVVEAVEIENDHVFVAGTANPGKVIRVYANRDLIGETLSSEIGRYLVESTRGLAVGEYIIRADMLEVGSAEVIARAAVPFEREAGEAIAAVAPPAANTAEDGEAEIHEAGADAESGENDASSAGPEDGSDTGTIVARAEPGDETMAAEVSMDTETEISGENMASEGGDASADDSRRDEERSAASAEPERPAMAESEMREDKPSEEADAAGGETAEPQSSQVAAVVPGTIEHADFGEDIALTAPKLEKTSGSVIIRRGDTLWRISLRVYGRGIRYTTIYTANRNQIKDPHWIWPGQIFDVPGTSDDGEPADLDAIADRSPEALSSKANR